MSSLGLKLLPLTCPSCGSGLAAEGTDVVYFCVSCRNGYLLEEGEGEPLRPVQVSFVVSPQPVDRYLPFWLLPATVHLLERKAGGAALNFLKSLFTGDDGQDGPGQGVFAVPAFDAPLQEVVELTLRYTAAFPQFGEILAERLTGGTVAVEDARKLAHYALIAAEARKPDTLQSLDYRLELGDARLLGVGFLRTGSGWADAHFRLPVSIRLGT